MWIILDTSRSMTAPFTAVFDDHLPGGLRTSNASTKWLAAKATGTGSLDRESRLGKLSL